MLTVEYQDAWTFRKLNPFVFPAETKGRFLMLIVAALAFTVTLGSLFLIAVVLRRSDFGDRGAATARKQLKWLEVYPLSMGSVDKGLIENEMIPFFRSALRVQLQRLATPIIAVLLLWLVSSVLYRRHPQRLRRHYKSKPLTKRQAPIVCSGLANWIERLGLPCPKLEYGMGLAQGHAFGLRGKEILLLNGNPEVLERSWPGLYRTIALHELAHIANEDAGDREKAAAVWKALSLLLIIYTMLFFLLGVRLHWLFWVRVAMILLIVQVIRSGLIRVREFYADWRASSWGISQELCRMLMVSEAVSNPWERYRWWWWGWERWGERVWWRMTWMICEKISRILRRRFHPSSSTRLGVLSEPSRLFRVSSDLPFLVGFLLGFGFTNCAPLFCDLMITVFDASGLVYASILHSAYNLPAGTSRDFFATVSALVLYGVIPLVIGSTVLFGASYLVVRTLGLQVQRQALTQILCGGIRMQDFVWLLKPAAFFGIGIETGLVMSPLIPLVPQALGIWTGAPLWMCGVIVSVWLWLIYVYGLSYRLFGSHVGHTIPRRRQRVVAWSSTLLLMFIYWPILLGRFSLMASFSVAGLKTTPWETEVAKDMALMWFMFMVILLITIAIYILFVCISWLSLSLGPWRHRPRCPRCGREVSRRIIAGRACEHCDQDLTPWLFAGDVREYARAG